MTVLCGDFDEASEVVDEASARCLARWDSRKPLDDPTAWTYRVVVNLARRRAWRRGRERAALEKVGWPVTVVIPEPAVELWREVAELPRRQWFAVILRYVGGLTEPQIAETMGVTAGAVAASLSAARAGLPPVSESMRSPAMSLDQRFDVLAQMHLREPTTVEHLREVTRRRTRRRRAQQVSALVVVIAVVTLAAIRISQPSSTERSVKTTGSPSTKVATTTVARPTTSPSTVLNPTAPVDPPFTVDNGALTVSARKPPQDVSKDQAVGLLGKLVPQQRGNQTGDPTYAVLSSRATLIGALGAPALRNTPAWIIRHQENYLASCPSPAQGLPQPPPTASKISVAIITGPDLADVTMYEGAGTYLCSPRLHPEAILGTHFFLQVTRP